MHAAEAGDFDKEAFVKAVEEAIAAQAPKTLEEADQYAQSGKADSVKDQVGGQVQAGKAQSAAAIGEATAAPPDTAAAPDKPVSPLAGDTPPPTPAPPDPALAVPDKAPPAATDFSAGPAEVDQQLSDAGVTEDQLANSNEPAFADALSAKKQGEAHAATAPAKVRASESRILSATKAAAARLGGGAIAAMAASRAQAGKAMVGGQQETKTADETRRAQVAAKLQAVFDATKKAVEEILTGLDAKVEERFTTEEKAARDAFTAEHQKGMAEYKAKRYAGAEGALRWLGDLVSDLPKEADDIVTKARQGYVTRMRTVITSVADLIGTELGRAKTRISEGRAELKAEVDKLPDDLKALGREKAGEFEQKFDELGESVKNKGQGLVQTLASKYTEALGKVDDEVAAEKEKNKGLVSKAKAAVGGAIKTIMQLKDMLLGVLAKAASAVTAIIKDPIGFLGNLVSAVGAGLQAFLSNIVEHLKKGLFGWLLGAASSMGLQLPKTFDLRGILGMLATLFGLTWPAIKSRIVQRVLKLGIPQRAITAIETGVTIVQKLQTQGLSGVIDEVKEKIGDLKENLVGKLTEYLVPTVLKAGIIWIVSLLNPASAFVKACKAIIDFVSFIVERGSQIMEFVGSVLDAVIAIAKGGGGGVPALVEKALARSVPVLIGALAALLGIGGIANKVKEFIQSLSKPVMSAVDWVVDKVVTLGKRIWARMRSGRSGAAGTSDSRNPAEKLKAVRAAVREVEAVAGSKPDKRVLQRSLAGIRGKHKLARLYLESAREGGFRVVAELNPRHTSREYPAGETKYTVMEEGEQVLRPEYRGAQPIRRRLYSSSNRAATQRIIRARIASLLRKQAGQGTGWEVAQDVLSATHWEPEAGQIVSLRDERTKPTLAHDEPVVAHWNRVGNNTTQAERIKFYHFRGAEDTARVIMFYLNRDEAPGGEYTHKVGPAFSEPGR